MAHPRLLVISAPVVLGAAAPSSLLNGLIASWEMSETSDGTSAVQRNDASVNALHLTDNARASVYTLSGTGIAAQGTAARTVTDVGLGAGYLTHVNTPLLNCGNQDWFISVWFYANYLDGDACIIDKGLYAGAGYGIEINSSSDNRIWCAFLAPGHMDYLPAATFGVISTATWYLVNAWFNKNAGTINIQINNGAIDSAAHTGGASDAVNLGIGARASAATYPLRGRVQFVRIWNRVLTVAERTTLWGGGFGIAYPFQDSPAYALGKNNYRFEGDSLTVGTSPAPQTPYPNQTITLLGGSPDWSNVATNGNTAALVIGEGARVDTFYNPAYGKNIVCLWIGTNDLGAGTGAAAVWGNIKTYCAARKQLGYKTVVLTITPRADAGWTGAMETERGLLNTSILGGDTSISAVANVASLTNLADPNNTTYYQADKMHLTTAGYAEVAGLVSATIGTL